MRPKAVAGRVARGLRVALISLGLAWGAGELGVRWLLFGEGSVPQALGASLRDPNRFADALSDDDFWRLQRRFQDDIERDQFARPHPELGWLPGSVSSRDLAHRDEESLGGRRPVLLYGDSFSACVAPSEDCWETLLDESALSSEYRMLNFGTCAYGLDQIVLLLERSVDRYLEQDPIVVIGVFVDEDLDRCALSFRGHPKPQVIERSEDFAWQYPGDVGVEEWLEQHPISPRSYLGELFLGSGLVPRGCSERSKADSIALKQERATWLLQRMRELLRERELDHFVVLFHGERLAAGREGVDWREAFLLRTLEELQIPYVSSREALFADHIATGRVARDYFLKEGALSGHYTASGNEAVFPAMVAGFRGDYHRAKGIEAAQASR